MSVGSELAAREAQIGILPVLPEERIWGFGDFTWVNIGLAIATWAFLIGGTLSTFVDLRTGIAAAVIGNVISVALMALATCAPSGKWGLEQYTALRSVFGANGVRIVVLVWLVAIEVGWAAVLSIMFGRSTTHVVNAVAGTDFGPEALSVTLFAAAAIVACWLVLSRGPISIKWVNRVVAPGLFVVQLLMVCLLLGEHDWATLAAITPEGASGDRDLDFMLAVEINMAAGFSWWPVLGSLARMTKTRRASFWPNMIGLCGAAVIGETVGLMAGLALGEADPTVWMIPLGGIFLGALALLWIALANVTSAVSIAYSTCLALKQVATGPLRAVSWPALTAGFFLIPLVLTLWPGAVYDNFQQFLIWSGVAFAPLSAVYLVDYFVLRRQVIDLHALYDDGPRASYRFFAGFNPAALIAIALGSTLYVLMLNPATFEQTLPGFRWLTASLPAFAVAGVVHYALTRLWIRARGLGGYAEQETPG